MTPINKKFYFILPAIVLPFLCLIFYALGGGKGKSTSYSSSWNLNHQLPPPDFFFRKDTLDKMSSYEKADRDSMNKKKLEGEMPHIRIDQPAGPMTKDTKSDDLLRQLNSLRQTLEEQDHTHNSPTMVPMPQQNPLPPSVREPEVEDPQLAKIDRMLDKVMRIQHPAETTQITSSVHLAIPDNVLPLDSGANTISVVVPEMQVLTSGATIALRLQDSIRIGRTLIPGGHMIYGVVTVNNDRMLIRISSIWSDRNIYTTDLQAYDIDGLPGIHIPGSIGRDVAKQSADQGLSGFNLNYDPSIAGQATNAGVQAAKSLFSRKVKQVRITVRAGYRLLLHDQTAKKALNINENSGIKPAAAQIRPPDFVSGGPYLRKCKVDGIALALQAICIKDETLWFHLILRNTSSITYIPEFTRWFIRDRRIVRRTAVQDWPLTPVCSSEHLAIPPDSTLEIFIGFRPFAISKGKELIVEIGEKNSGRTLSLEINHNQILNAGRL